MNKKMKSANDIIPGDIFHPGEHLKDEIESRNMSQQELAAKMGMSKSEISLLLNGHRNITPVIAVNIEKALKIDAEIWMNLQVKYDLDMVRKKAKNAIRHSKLSSSQKNKLQRHIKAA